MIDELTLEALSSIVTKYMFLPTAFFGIGAKGHMDVMLKIQKTLDARLEIVLENKPLEKTINLVIPLLEKGVFEQKCNLKGNYANLCTAIVNKFQHMDS